MYSTLAIFFLKVKYTGIKAKRQSTKRFLHKQARNNRIKSRLHSKQIAGRKKCIGEQLLSRGGGDQIFEHVEQAHEPQC